MLLRVPLVAVVAVLAASVVLALPIAPATAQVVGDWVPLADATIHPGVQTVTDGGQCTANFVFTDDEDVYLGQAAHCASDSDSSETNGCVAATAPLGEPVEIDGARMPGTVVYSSWVAMQAAGETDPNVCAYNDFALVRLDRADRAAVNPSIPFYGGPTGLIDTTVAGDPVYTFGNSSLRPDNGSAKQGTTQGPDGDGWTHDVRTTLNPGVPGDSGSAFIDLQGRAFGVLSTLEVLPNPGSNGVSDLSRMLAYMAAAGGPDVDLAIGTLAFSAAGEGVDTATGAASPGAEVDRLAGPARIETAVTVSRAAFAADAAGAVVLARADVAADALAGTPLAAAKNGPVLLTAGTSLPAATSGEIDRVLPTGGTVYVLGGPAAVSTGVEAGLTQRGYDVQRLAGGSRIETAIAVANVVDANPGEILLADGLTHAAALVAGPAAHSVGGVVLLTNGAATHPAVDAYLAAHPDANVTAIGDPATTAYPDYGRLQAASDPDLSRTVAEAFLPDAVTVGVARVDDFADALAGGAHVARLGGPVLLSDSGSLSAEVELHLSVHANDIGFATLYGGTAALSAQVEADVRAAIAD